MKTIKIAKIPVITGALLLSCGFAFGQNADDVIKQKFPETVGNLAITPSTTYNPKLKADYRALYTKLETGLDEIEKFELGGAEAEILSVFDLKTLKDMQKSGTLKDLTSGIKSEQKKIATLMREEKYGADSAKCIRNLSMYTEFVKQNNLKDAYAPWTILFSDYPMAHSNIYQGGVSIVKQKMKEAKDRNEQERWIDTLMMVYDQRIKYFAKSSKKYGEAYLLGRKGVDLIKFRPKPEDAPYNILTKAVNMGGENTEHAVIQCAMQSVIGMYNAEKIDAAEVVDKYLQYSDLAIKLKTSASNRLASATTDKDKAAAQKDMDEADKVIGGVDNLFSNSTAAQCETLEKAFAPRFKANPNDIDLCDKIVNILDRKGCKEIQLYEDATVKLAEKRPSELAYRSLAYMMEKKGKQNEAIDNYKKAIDLAAADTMKASYCFSIAKLLHKQNKFGEARNYANKAIQYKPNFGAPYILIAVMYGSNPVGEDAFDKSKTYWVVIDKLNKAKAVDPSVANEANSLIGRYKGSCPKKEEAFMHSVHEGSTVTVGGWIGETTTARF